MSIGAVPPPRLLLTADDCCCSLVNAVVVLWCSMVVERISAYVGAAPALSCRCCWSGPLVSFINTAILTGSGSRVVLSFS